MISIHTAPTYLAPTDPVKTKVFPTVILIEYDFPRLQDPHSQLA